MRRLRLGLLMVGALLASVVQAGDPSSWKQWIDDLGNSSFEVRERATKHLLRAGVDVEPTLRKAHQSADLEVRRRIDIVLARIEREAVLVSLLNPRPLSVRFADVATVSALESFGREFGFPTFVLRRPFAPTLTLNPGPLPLWKAWQTILDKAELIDLPISSRHRLEQSTLLNLKVVPISSVRLLPMDAKYRKADKSPRAFIEEHGFLSEPFDFRMAEEVGTFRFRGQRGQAVVVERNNHMSPILIELLADPRVTLTTPPTFTLSKVLGGDGKNLLSAPQVLRPNVLDDDTPDRRNTPEPTRDLGFLAYFTVPAKHLLPGDWKSLEGVAAVRCDVRHVTLKIENLQKALGQWFEDRRGISLKPQAVRIAPTGKLEVEVWVSGPEQLVKLGFPKSYKKSVSGVILVRDPVKMAMDELEIQMPNGAAIAPEQVLRDFTKSDGQGRVSATLSFPIDASVDSETPWTLIWRTPRSIDLDVPFVLRSSPLRSVP